MFSIETITALLELVVASNQRSGRTTKEYQGLYKLFMEGIAELAPVPNGILSQAEINVGQQTGKLDAVKMYKERTKESLMDSKRTVEKFFEDNNLKFKSFS